MLRFQPEIHAEHSPERQRQHGLDVASIAAHVGGTNAGRRLDALVAQFQGKRNLMPVPAPPVGGRNRHRRAVERQIVFPRALLIGEQLHSHLIFLDRAGVHHPDHRAARFFLAALHSDHVTHFQLDFDSGNQCAPRTDVLSASMLGKGPSLGAHSP